MKYSEQEFEETELDIFTLIPCKEESRKSIVETKKELVCEPSSVIQYWINTGYLPYKMLSMNKDKSDVGLFTENSASSLHPRSSSSSVDTAAYILSNMNVTNKVETMAIIEGAKDNSVITFQNAQDIEIIQDKMHKTNNENVILKNNTSSITLENNDNSTNHMFQRKNINVEEYITKAQRNSNDDDVDILSETINTDNETTNKYKSDYNKLLTNKKLRYTFDLKLSDAEEPYLIEENYMLEDNFTKLGRKKLYTGRDSPVDLTRTESSKRSTTSISTSLSNSSLHPALDFGLNSSKKFKKYNKSRSYHFAPFHKLINNSRFSVPYYDKRKRRTKKGNVQNCKTSLTNAIKDTVSINQRTTDSSMLNQYLVKGKTDKCANSSLYKKQTNKQKKFNESINCLQEMNIERYQKTNTTKNLENLNPLLCITRLSNDDIGKHKKLKKTTNINNLNTIRLPEINTERHKRSNKTTNMKHLVVRLSRLSKRDIEKYKKSNNVKSNLNPVIRLKRLSELEIQKYTKSNTMKSSENLDTVTSLNRTLNKSDVLYKTQLQNNSVNDVDQLSSSNIMNLLTGDTTSESSIFICKCDNTSFADDCSIDNLCMFSKSSLYSYSSTVKSHMLQIEERFHNKRKRLNSEVRNKKVDTSKTCVKKGVKRINNKRSLELNTSKNNLGRKYATGNGKHTKVYSMDNSFNNNSKASNVNKDVHHTNDIALCTDEPKIVFENNNANANKNKKREYITFSSDEDDGFVKLVHCSEDIQKSKLRKQHKALNKNFNTVEKLETILSNQSFSESRIKDTKFKRMNENCNQKVQTEIKNQTKLLSINKKREFLCFRTKIFDSDSETLTA